MKATNLPPLRLDLVEPFGSLDKEIPKEGFSLSRVIGISLITVYSFVFGLALSLFYLPLEVVNQTAIEYFVIAGITSLFLLLLWISFTHQKYPAIATTGLRIVSLSIPFYIWMSLPRIY
jgi:uncharacterized protein YqhQ